MKLVVPTTDALTGWWRGTPDGRAFEAIYDHPVAGDKRVARIVSVWRLD